MDNILKSFLNSLGLSQEEAKIYCCLLEDNNQTPLELSRKTKIPRTNVYRSIKSLKEKDLLPASPGQLEKMVEVKIIEAQNLRAQLPSVLKLLKKDEIA